MKLRTKVVLSVVASAYIGLIVLIRTISSVRPFVVSAFRLYFFSLMIDFFLGNIVSGFHSRFFEKLGDILASVFMYGVYLTLVLAPLYLAARL